MENMEPKGAEVHDKTIPDNIKNKRQKQLLPSSRKMIHSKKNLKFIMRVVEAEDTQYTV